MSVYHISSAEIHRRVWAYSSLVTFWIGAQALLAWLWPPSNAEVGWVFLAVEACALILLGAATFYFFFTRFIKSAVELDEKHLARSTVKGKYRTLLTEITEIEVKNTTRHLVRQVSVKCTNGQGYNFDGLEDFDEFITALKAACPNARYSIRNERFDYDSLLFYPLLGAIMAFVITVFVRGAIDSPQFLDTFYLLFMFYIAGMSVFFALKKPLAKQYGKKSAVVDYAASLVCALSVLLLLWLRLK